jgi:general secretion pathway protein K
MAHRRNSKLSPAPRHRLRRRQRGVALLTALLVVAVATVLATHLLWLSTLDQRRTAAALATDQALQYVLGAEAWAGDILSQDREDSPNTDDLSEIWALEIDPLPIEGGFIVGRLSDPQGLFNLNNLVTTEGEEDEIMVAQFERLLAVLGLDTALAGAVVDWIDPGVEPHFPTGGEDAAYLRSEPQYRVANGMITTPSELMAIVGFNPETYAELAPFVTALPRGTWLNVNTAPQEILASLADEIDMSVAASLIRERGEGAFANVQTTFEGLVSEDMLPRIDGVSDHFLLTGEVTIGDTQLTISSMLQRHSSGITRALFRSFGRQ